MTLSSFLKLYAIALPTFLVIDFIWLKFIARSFYQNQIGDLMRSDVNLAAAIVFYLVFNIGIVILAVWPAIQRRSHLQAFLLGALLGIVTYAAYDLTNLAILEGFPIAVALVDMGWGAVLCASVSSITYSVARLYQSQFF
jgi:uncharacterized membrane protein